MRRERFKLADRAVFTRLSSLRNLDKFSCGKFFKDEAVKYEEELLAKSYAFCDVENDNAIICMFSVSCDGIHTALLPGPVKNKIQRAIPNAKRMRRYPAILINTQCKTDETLSGDTDRPYRRQQSIPPDGRGITGPHLY